MGIHSFRKNFGIQVFFDVLYLILLAIHFTIALLKPELNIDSMQYILFL